jgi:hypothetical protein
MHISVGRVDLENEGLPIARTLEPQGHGFRSSGMFRRGVIPDCDHQCSIFPPGDQGRIRIHFQPLIPKIVQKLKGIECGLGNAILRNQPKPALEGRFHHPLLFENVRKCPVRHQVDEAGALPNGIREPRPHE